MSEMAYKLLSLTMNMNGTQADLLNKLTNAPYSTC